MSAVTGQAHGNGAPHSPIPCSCSPVYTLWTPAIPSAADVSIPVIVAWATVERTIPIHNSPGAWMSSTYLPSPVSSLGSSLRFMRVPMAVMTRPPLQLERP